VSEQAFPAARRALAYLETYSFDPRTVERLRIGVDDAERALLARREAVERDVARQDVETELGAALCGSCLEFDPAPAAAVLRRWTRLQPAFARAGRAQIGEAVTRCLAHLEAVDRERALELRTGSARLFGSLPGLKVVREDPCGASYLVGTGNQSGRRGSCVDRVSDTGQGPRLVVVPASEQGVPFAITRQEVSWAEMRPFCQETGRCVAEADDLPVRNIGVDLARDYATWLTERTGFSYRLPTYREWLQAAAGTSDPNRNCQVQLGGVHRGLAPVAAGTGTPNPFGLVNVLGNVQEWVIDVGEIKVAGGAFRDPIADCAVTTLRAHRGAADPATGFRLVREVS
jgi:hypothetical protein